MSNITGSNSFKPNDDNLRHELKFVVSLDDGTDFFQSCLSYCHPDAHADSFQSYEVASLYYDTEDLRFYRDREESVGYRRKIRLRSYNLNQEPTALFIEIKEKHRNKGTKKRLKFKDKDFLNNYKNFEDLTISECLKHYDNQCSDDSAGNNHPVARELKYLDEVLKLEPKLIVRYVRRTLISNSEDTLRITLDQRLTTGGRQMAFYDAKQEKYFLSPQKAILEIKSNDQLPVWLQNLLLKYGFSKTRYSKYCDAVRCLGDKQIESLTSAYE